MSAITILLSVSNAILLVGIASLILWCKTLTRRTVELARMQADMTTSIQECLDGIVNVVNAHGEQIMKNKQGVEYITKEMYGD